MTSNVTATGSDEAPTDAADVGARPTSCCSPAKQSSCCDASEKAGCCGEPAATGGTCGCQ